MNSLAGWWCQGHVPHVNCEAVSLGMVDHLCVKEVQQRGGEVSSVASHFDYAVVIGHVRFAEKISQNTVSTVFL